MNEPDLQLFDEPKPVSGRDEEEKDWLWFTADPRGVRILRTILADCGVWRTSFADSDRMTSFREGERNVGLRLIAKTTEYAPEKLPAILKAEEPHG